MNNIEVAIIIGHKPTAKGAYNQELNLWEYDLNVELSTALIVELESRGITCKLVHRTKSYSQLPNDVNKLNPKFFISVHHNGASDTSINGTETLYWWKSSKSKKAATFINNHMVEALGYKDRGLKPIKKGHNGWLILRNTKMAGVLIEPYFTTNKRAILERDYKVLAKSIVDAYVIYKAGV